MGRSGLKTALAERKTLASLRDCSSRVAGRAVGVDTAASAPPAPAPLGPTYLVSMLFSRGVSGTRVVAPGQVRRRRIRSRRFSLSFLVCLRCVIEQTLKIGKLVFTGYGSQCGAYPCAYITAAAALCMTRADVQVYCERLDDTIHEFKRQASSRLEKGAVANPVSLASLASAGTV